MAAEENGGRGRHQDKKIPAVFSFAENHSPDAQDKKQKIAAEQEFCMQRQHGRDETSFRAVSDQYIRESEKRSDMEFIENKLHRERQYKTAETDGSITHDLRPCFPAVIQSEPENKGEQRRKKNVVQPDQAGNPE